MAKFEYHSEKDPSDEKMNELGREGWDLVLSVGNKFVFKRAKSVMVTSKPKALR